MPDSQNKTNEFYKLEDEIKGNGMRNKASLAYLSPKPNPVIEYLKNKPKKSFIFKMTKSIIFPVFPVSTQPLGNQMVGGSKFPSKEIFWLKK